MSFACAPHAGGGRSPARWIDGAVVTGEPGGQQHHRPPIADLRNSPFQARRPGTATCAPSATPATPPGLAPRCGIATAWATCSSTTHQAPAPACSTPAWNWLRAAPAARRLRARGGHIASSGYSLSVQGYGDSATDTRCATSGPRPTARKPRPRWTGSAATTTIVDDHRPRRQTDRTPGWAATGLVAGGGRPIAPTCRERRKSSSCAPSAAAALWRRTWWIGPSGPKPPPRCQRSAVITVRPTLAQGDPPRFGCRRAACRAGAHRADGQLQCGGRGHARTHAAVADALRTAAATGPTSPAPYGRQPQHRRARPGRQRPAVPRDGRQRGRQHREPAGHRVGERRGCRAHRHHTARLDRGARRRRRGVCHRRSRHGGVEPPVALQRQRHHRCQRAGAQVSLRSRARRPAATACWSATARAAPPATGHAGRHRRYARPPWRPPSSPHPPR